MLPLSRLVARLLLLLIVPVWLLSGCGSQPPPTPVPVAAEPPTISDPQISAPTPQEPGQEIGIAIDVSSATGVSLTYDWQADGGEIVRGQNSPAITYRTPDEPGIYNVRVTVKWDTSSVEKVTTIRVEAPEVAAVDEPPPDTPTPEVTEESPTATPIPPTSTRQPTNTPERLPDTPTPEPTNTPRPTPVPTATIDADPTVYDNFNNPAFDGNVNLGRWDKKMPWGTCSIQQQDGKVTFSSGASNTSLCVLSAPLTPSAEAGAIEALIYAEPGNSGSYNIGVIQYYSELDSDKGWFAQCGIAQDPNENWVSATLNVDTSPSQEGANSWYDGGGLTLGEWYKFRLELYPNTLEVKCYLNDVLFASHIPEQAELIRANGVSKEVIGFWSDNAQSTYHFDDVRFFPNSP